jgi:transposase
MLGIKMKRFVEGQDRGQSTLFPECLEDWVGEDNPVRVIDVFVNGLDLAGLGFIGVEAEATGRPAYHPSVLVKLYIYGYLNRVQSSRRLEREAGRNTEVMWLLGRLIPDHKTIADFRKDNGAPIRKVCGQFIALCRAMGLLTQASVAIDGSKFKAVNTRDKNFTRAKMERRLAQIDESVSRYLSQLDTADLQEPSEALAAKTTHLKEKLAKLASELERLKGIEQAMLASPDQQISLTDPDSRSMATSGRGSGVVGYNVQIAVDTQHHLIVAHEVTNTGSDRSQLANMASQAKDVLGTDHLDAVADRGYYSSPEILACEQADITVTMPKPMTSGAKHDGRFGMQDFVYLASEDDYRCPAGEKLTYRYTSEEDGSEVRQPGGKGRVPAIVGARRARRREMRRSPCQVVGSARPTAANRSLLPGASGSASQQGAVAITAVRARRRCLFRSPCSRRATYPLAGPKLRRRNQRGGVERLRLS